MRIRFIAPAIMALALSACSVGHQDAAFDAEHNAQTALDWAGTYSGVLPCADCEGIKTVVTLKDNGTYQSRAEYLGKGDAAFEEKGQFHWDKAGNTITLEQADPEKYFVTENRLIRLGADGARITGPMAELYILTKQPSAH